MANYDVVSIGGGTAGMTVARLASAAGARVCLVDREHLGGDCLYTGCVPTKTLVASARLLHEIRRAPSFGVDVAGARLNYSAVRGRVHKVMAEIAATESPEVFRDLGIDVKFGEASFVSPTQLQVGSEMMSAEKFVVATGSRAVIPPIPGLDKAQPLTNVGLLELEELPESLAIIGSGPIGTEFSQIFCRFGTRVTVIDRAEQILPREDPETAGLLMEVLANEGVRYLCGATVTRVTKTDVGSLVEVERESGATSLEARQILVAVGRRPNVESLNLDRAGVEFDSSGIRTDDYLRTTAPNVWACGDVAGKYQFTHVAYEQAVAVARNLQGKRTKWNDAVVPWTTFTDPELARAGLTEAEARERYGGKVRAIQLPFAQIDRALCEGEPQGLIKLITIPGWTHGRFGGEVVGAHILGRSAGELLPEILVAMRSRLPIGLVARPIHVYPTLGLGIRQVIGQLFESAE